MLDVFLDIINAFDRFRPFLTALILAKKARSRQ
jgi:hypothetical protein